jgi:hypothetical protein
VSPRKLDGAELARDDAVAFLPQHQRERELGQLGAQVEQKSETLALMVPPPPTRALQFPSQCSHHAPCVWSWFAPVGERAPGGGSAGR